MHWEQYWDVTPTLSSFGDSSDALGYPEKLLNFWEKAVKSYGSDIHYLDLGTGKGALAVWIQVLLARSMLGGNVKACDLANIDETKISSGVDELDEAIKHVEFKFNTPLERLPYPNNQFDVLASQFGFEYSDWDKSLPEALRVLKDNGELILMLHHPDSAITKDCIGGIRVLTWFFNENILDDIATLIDLKLRDESISFAKLNEEIIHKLQTFKVLDSAEQVWFLDVMTKLSKLIININHESKKVLKNLEEFIGKQISRLEDQVSVAFSKEEVTNRIKKSQVTMKNVIIEEFFVDNELFCWKVLITK